MKRLCRRFFIALCLVFYGGCAFAFCDPPIAPQPTQEDIAREYQEEFKAEFEAYFSAAREYISCIDNDRARVLQEMNFTAQRYARFLCDKQKWVAGNGDYSDEINSQYSPEYEQFKDCK